MKQSDKKCPFCEIPCPYDHCAWKEDDDKHEQKPEDTDQNQLKK